MLHSFSPRYDIKTVPVSPRQAQRQRQSQRDPGKLAAATISYAAVSVALVVFLWGLALKTKQFSFNIRQEQQKAEDSSFCCLAFLESLSLDHDRSPCEDFRRYVCPRRFNKTSTFRWNTWNAVEALTRVRSHPEALSGKLLAGLRAQCEALLGKGPVHFVKAMTPMLLRGAGVPNMANADHLLLLMAFLSLRFRVKTPIRITIADAYYPTFQVEAPLQELKSSLTFFNHTCPECIGEALDSVKAHTGNSVRREDFFAFEASLERRLESSVFSCSPNLFRTLGANTTWEKLVSGVFNISATDVRMACTTRPSRIFAAFERYASPRVRPVALASVVVHALASIFQELTANGTANRTLSPLGSCLFQEDFPDIWTNFYAEMVVSSSRNKRIRDIFVRVTTALRRVAANLIPPKDYAALLFHLQRLSPFLPFSVLPRSLRPPSTPEDDFSDQFLLISNYEFWLETNRRRRHFPAPLLTGDSVFISEPWAVFTPLAYPLIDVANDQESIMNLPVVGIPLAKALWSFLFDKEPQWLTVLLDDKTTSSSCLHNRDRNLTRRKEVLETVLALRTVLRIVDTRDWNKAMNVSPKWQDVTASRIFFLRLGDSMCDGRDNSPSAYLNAALELSLEFATAFKCSEGLSMERYRCEEFYLDTGLSEVLDQ
ncbi:hypothetical protein V5799_010406 [Amblyomma americanum]|uniref:Uncharacterized protein n=1 Tax=Amblyomma americanum TaxID=6943 RepID=A0AAQ4EJW9_AMBAM